MKLSKLSKSVANAVKVTRVTRYTKPYLRVRNAALFGYKKLRNDLYVARE